MFEIEVELNTGFTFFSYHNQVVCAIKTIFPKVKLENYEIGWLDFLTNWDKHPPDLHNLYWIKELKISSLLKIQK